MSNRHLGHEDRWIPPINISPLDGESIRGFLLRYCDENGWPSFRQFCQLIGIKPVAVYNGEGLEVLAHALRLPLAELQAIVPSRVSTLGVDYFGHRLPTALLRGATRSVCPDCIAEEGHARWWWEFEFAQVCHVHSLALVDTCGCGAPLSWGDASLGCCKTCSIEGNQIELDRDCGHLGGYELWCLAKSGVLPIALPPVPVLNELDIRAATQLLDAVASLMEFGYSHSRPALPDAVDNSRSRRELAFRLIAEGQIAFLVEQLYFGYRSATGRDFPERPIDLLGWFATEFQFLRPLYPSFTFALEQAMEEVLQLPVTDLCRLDYLPLASLTKEHGFPEDVAIDFLRLTEKIDALLDHPLGTLIRTEVEPDIRALASRVRRA